MPLHVSTELVRLLAFIASHNGCPQKGALPESQTACKEAIDQCLFTSKKVAVDVHLHFITAKGLNVLLHNGADIGMYLRRNVEKHAKPSGVYILFPDGSQSSRRPLGTICGLPYYAQQTIEFGIPVAVTPIDDEGIAYGKACIYSPTEKELLDLHAQEMIFLQHS